MQCLRISDLLPGYYCYWNGRRSCKRDFYFFPYSFFCGSPYRVFEGQGGLGKCLHTLRVCPLLLPRARLGCVSICIPISWTLNIRNLSAVPITFEISSFLMACALHVGSVSNPPYPLYIKHPFPFLYTPILTRSLGR